MTLSIPWRALIVGIRAQEYESTDHYADGLSGGIYTHTTETVNGVQRQFVKPSTYIDEDPIDSGFIRILPGGKVGGRAS